MAKFCTKCGSSIDMNAAFCSKCGNPVGVAINKTQTEQQQQAQQNQSQQYQAQQYQSQLEQQKSLDQNPLIGFQSNPRLLIKSLTNKLSLAGTFWFIAAILQFATGYIYLDLFLKDLMDVFGNRIRHTHLTYGYEFTLMFTIFGILLILLTVVSFIYGILSFSSKKKIRNSPVGIIRKYEPLRVKVFMLLFGIITGTFGFLSILLNWGFFYDLEFNFGVIGGLFVITAAIINFSIRSFVLKNYQLFEQLERQHTEN